jgi:hypothetical protein
MSKKNGFLYLIQTESDLDTNIFKYGRSVNPKYRFIAYGYLNIIKCERVKDMINAETELMTLARCVFGKPVRGKEYFQIDDLDQGIDLFNEIVSNYRR